MSSRFFKLGLAVLVPILMAASYWPPAGASPARTKLAIAFPKTYNHVETAVLYGDYIRNLQKCAQVDVVNLRGELIAERFDTLDLLPEAELIEHMKNGRLQLAQFTTGLVPTAVDVGQGEAFAVRGHTVSGKYDSYRLHLIVRADSSYRKPGDLAGTKIAHSTARSNSGNLAPRAYFPAVGLTPEKNYEVVYSGSHERSIMGTYYGFWKGAAIASDQFERMARKGEIKAQDFRVLWTSEPFPVEAMVLSREVTPEVQQRVRRCTLAYRFTPKASGLLNGADGFIEIDADKAFAGVRFVLERAKSVKP